MSDKLTNNQFGRVLGGNNARQFIEEHYFGVFGRRYRHAHRSRGAQMFAGRFGLFNRDALGHDPNGTI